MHHNEHELAESNRELQTIRNSLEDQVTERTRSVEQARQAAEAANRALQAQMWQIAGQAELGEVMRGEQPLDTLAANIIQQLCKYLGAPVGALYLSGGRCAQADGRLCLPASQPSSQPIQAG